MVNIEVTKYQSEDKNIDLYNFNNDVTLQIIKHGDKGIWKTCINYDDDNNYNESTILGLSLTMLLSFSDLGYLEAFDFKNPYKFLKTKVMNTTRNKRGTIGNEYYTKNKIINDKEVKVLELTISPSFRWVCVESLEEH